MKKIIYCIVFSLFFANLIYTFATNRNAYTSENFSAKGRMFQPMPTGYGTPGKDSGSGKGLHNTGMDCGLCHRPDDSVTGVKGKASKYPFTMAGTIYEDRAARRPLAGAEVILQDYEGNVLSMLTNEAGNFWTTAKLAGNPLTIASHSGTTHELYTLDASGKVATPASSTDSRTWQYKAWVRVGNHVRPMVSIVPVGNAIDSNSRMSCNMHHSPFGSSGAVWALNKGTLSSYPASALSFRRHIAPIFMNKCQPCHIPGSTKTRLAMKSDNDANSTAVDYSQSQDFTSYAGSSVSVTSGGKTTVIVKKGIKDLVQDFASSPDSSPVLSKTLIQSDGSVKHAGGGFWTVSDPDYLAIKQWISEGALNN